MVFKRSMWNHVSEEIGYASCTEPIGRTVENKPKLASEKVSDLKACFILPSVQIAHWRKVPQTSARRGLQTVLVAHLVSMQFINVSCNTYHCISCILVYT